MRIECAMRPSMMWARLTPLRTASTPVSYTHLDVYKRQVCGRPLTRDEKAWACKKGHSFDVASEGYVYLLPPNKKHSKDPGDTKQMVAARRAFLEAGCYEPFRRRLCELACERCV